VALLSLNADWVVLSACNTGAAARQGAEALSGLAQSFFYAGARTLLVSHWAVDDYAAKSLMLRTFQELARAPEAGKAEALRQAMLAMITDQGSGGSAYPSYWAPFSIVGLGGRQ